jgi:hypothetical protein
MPQSRISRYIYNIYIITFLKLIKFLLLKKLKITPFLEAVFSHKKIKTKNLTNGSKKYF